MITRLYANNYRCLVAFEAKFGPFGLLCGPNGAGKSSAFQAVRHLRNLATGDEVLEEAVRFTDHTNWLDSTTTEFEIDVRVEGREFTYVLHVEQVTDLLKPRIVKERASCDGKPLFERDLEGIRFVKATGAQPGFPLDWRQAALGAIQPASDRREVEMLQHALADVIVLEPNPVLMEAESRAESPRPDRHLGNLTSWFRSLSQEQEWTDHLREALQDVWPDLRSFRLVNTGLNAKALMLRFDSSGSPESGELSAEQLSDGERALLGLCMVRSAMATGAVRTVLIDEPDNFVGLPELQPWTLSLMSLLGTNTQAILVSHHPELLDLAGDGAGLYLWRDSHTSPTRIGPLRVPEGLSAGEAVARGWLGG
jgi:hypothetical protein